MGKLFFTMMNVFAELEANLLSERVKRRLEVLRAHGRSPIDEEKKEKIKKLYNTNEYSIDDIFRISQVNKSITYNTVKNK